jgi:hypothetical protein
MVIGEPEKGHKSKNNFGHKDLKVIISDKNLQRVEEIKILGINIDNALSFVPHKVFNQTGVKSHKIFVSIEATSTN